MKRTRAGGRVLITVQEPTAIASALAQVFGARPKAALEKRTLIKGGKPVASGYQKVRRSS